MPMFMSERCGSMRYGGVERQHANQLLAEKRLDDIGARLGRRLTQTLQNIGCARGGRCRRRLDHELFEQRAPHLAELGAVERKDRDLRRSPGAHQALQHRDAVVGPDQSQAERGPPPPMLFAHLGGHADFRPTSPVDTEGGKPARVTFVGQRVEE